MSISHRIGDFLLSEWLWAFTFDWSHIFLSTGIMFMCLRLFSSGSFLRASLLAVGSHIFALAAFSGFVIGVMINMLQWEYTQTIISANLTATQVMMANLWLAAIFLFFQTFFFFVIQLFGIVRVLPFFFVALISNGIAALVSYGAIWMTVGYLF